MEEKKYFKDIVEESVPKLKKDLSHLIKETLSILERFSG